MQAVTSLLRYRRLHSPVDLEEKSPGDRIFRSYRHRQPSRYFARSPQSCRRYSVPRRLLGSLAVAPDPVARLCLYGDALHEAPAA